MNEAVNREDWLGKAALQLADRVLVEEDVPPLRISVGFPGGRANRQRTIGQCWSTKSSDDGVNQIFMSPIRGEDSTRDVLGTLLHEMIHAVDDCESGHRGNFARIARSVGFIPKLTSSDNRNEELNALLDEIAEIVGAFPHATLNVAARAADQPKKQEARMIKVVCPDCGYTLRTTRKWLDVGTPYCPCGTDMEEAS
jgi:hypothetical protein